MKIVFMGTPAAAVPTLERIIADGHEIAAVYTQPDRPSGRGNRVQFSPVKEFASGAGLKVLQPSKIRTPEAFEEFRSHGADVSVVVAYGRILPGSFLTATAGGAINVHFSLLPRYRGAAPVNWAIVNGESETGVTTMQMDEGLDTGDILMQMATQIGMDETAVELTARLALIGAEVLSETLRGRELLAPKPQDEALATMAPILKKEDGLVSWMLSAGEIERRVRGFQPFPTTFTWIGDKKLRIWRARPEGDTSVHRIGEVIEAKGDRLLIACGGGSILRIEEMQIEGKRRVAARDFLNGARIEPGQILGRAAV